MLPNTGEDAVCVVCPVPVAFETVAEADALAVRPSLEYAVTVRTCAPLASAVVSSRPFGSPAYWYGAICSVHLTTPSILNSTLVAAALGVAVHGTQPLIVAPLPMLDVTVNVPCWLGGGGVVPAFRTVTVDEALAFLPFVP